MNLIQKPRISRIVQRDKKKCNLNLSLSLSVLSRPVSRESGGIRAEDTDVHIIPVCLVSITTFWSSWYLPTIPSVSINLWRFACCYRSSCVLVQRRKPFLGEFSFTTTKLKLRICGMFDYLSCFVWSNERYEVWFCILLVSEKQELTNLPVLVMIISVPNSLNLSHNSLVSRWQSTSCSCSQLHLGLICGLELEEEPLEPLPLDLPDFLPDFFFGLTEPTRGPPTSSSSTISSLSSTSSSSSSSSSLNDRIVEWLPWWRWRWRATPPLFPFRWCPSSPSSMSSTSISWSVKEDSPSSSSTVSSLMALSESVTVEWLFISTRKKIWQIWAVLVTDLPGDGSTEERRILRGGDGESSSIANDRDSWVMWCPMMAAMEKLPFDLECWPWMNCCCGCCCWMALPPTSSLAFMGNILIVLNTYKNLFVSFHLQIVAAFQITHRKTTHAMK